MKYFKLNNIIIILTGKQTSNLLLVQKLMCFEEEKLDLYYCYKHKQCQRQESDFHIFLSSTTGFQGHAGTWDLGKLRSTSFRILLYDLMSFYCLSV